MPSTETKNEAQYTEIYNEDQYKKDEKSFSIAEIGKSNLDLSAFKRLMIHDICSHSDIIETKKLGRINLEDVQRALRNPRQHWKIILEASEILMRISPHYYRLNNMYSNMALFCWGIDLFDVKDKANKDTIKETYNLLAAKLETMQIKHEFSKIMKVLPSQDIFCGLIVDSPTDFFVIQINYDICKLAQIQDGLYNFKINLNCIDPKELSAYPDYVQDAYIEYTDSKKKNKQVSYWYTPPADKQICVKLNSQWTYPYPLMISIIQDILDLDVFKKLKLQSARTDNYKAILVQVPIDEKFVDKPLITPETLSIFAEINRESMSDDIGMIHTLGAKGEAISFKDSSNTRNNVSDAIDEVYNSSGVSKELFNGSSSATAVTLSVENDSALIYSVYRQFERWVNRFIKIRKFNKQVFKFSFYLVDITVFNRDSVSKRYREACTLGIPVIDKLLATLDMTPSRVLGSYIVHNDIFDYYNKFKPLTSTFNSSEAGRPTNEDKGKSLSDEGEKSADKDKNKN